MSRNTERGLSSERMLPKEIFGSRRVANHYTVCEKGYGQTHAGLHETEDKARKALSCVTREPRLKRATVIKLEEGQVYVPWGLGGLQLVHGITDGTHGSKKVIIKPVEMALEPRNRITFID